MSDNSSKLQFTFTVRNKLIESYSEFISDIQSRNMDAYFINFMFDHIAASEQHRKERMFNDIKRVHDILSRHIVRKPTSEAWRHLLPIFIVCPDYPVVKKQRGSIRAYNANEGLHMNAVVLVPPPPPSYLPPGVRQHPFFGKLSRLREPLDLHFKQSGCEYRTDKLYRIEVARITKCNMADYTLKNFKNGKVGYDDIRVF